MTYTPITPFGRTVDAAVLKHQQHAASEMAPQGANKWEVLRELSTSRDVFGLSDRDMTVLQALVSFHQATVLGGNDAELIVYPSNKSICERLNGMPDSTMRRHLGNLVQSGVILRRDSPNGKRYSRQFEGEKVAFGFDLTPLVVRFAEFCQAARAVRETQERLKRLREAVSLMRRDLAGLATYGAEIHPELTIWSALHDLAALTARDLRRKLGMDELDEIKARMEDALDAARDVFEMPNSMNMSGNDVRNEQHYQNSNKDSYVFEPCLEKAKGGVDRAHEKECSEDVEPEVNLPRIPLGLVLATCKEFKTYYADQVRHWHQLVRAAEHIRPMLGISSSAWADARLAMGVEQAAVVLVAMLERFKDIRSPGGYLRSLTSKAEQGMFSCGPMVMALMKRNGA